MREKRTSLLAKISPMLTVRTEDVAVEALGHILAGSEPARGALSDVLRTGGADVGTIAEVQTQVSGQDGARPDLAASDENGSKCVLVEAKFWAGLTENQPLTYLQRLPERKTSALLFVAPHARLESLWAELGRRIAKSDLGYSFKIEKHHEALLNARVREKCWLILTSWTSLLDRMATEVSAAGDSQTASDIAQLLGLAAHEDTTAAFMPLRAEELGPDLPRRLMGLMDLVDKATKRLVESGWASQKGLSKAYRPTIGHYQYLELAGAPAEFGIVYEKWATLCDTPLWLTLRDWKAKTSRPIKPLSEVKKKLESFRRCNPPELFEVGQRIAMPIELPLGLERDAVLDAIVNRLTEIAHQIDPAYRS